MNTSQEIKTWLLAFFVALVVGLAFREYCLEIYSVDGVSMLPTLSSEDKLIVEKISTTTNSFERGDILVFRYPRQTNKFYVKRIIGLPGDTVEINNGIVSVNGKELNEFTYTVERPEMGFQKDVVPNGSYFVLGDNRNNSEDSRFSDVGYVNKPLVVGKAVCVAWPVNHIKMLKLSPSEPIKNVGGITSVQ